ncbi:MAG: thiamine pyrophosphate-dependent dehydrogenase E1 component subunit alpha, partial [Christensenella sp.]
FWEYEPIKRMKEYFLKNKLLSEKEVDAIQRSAIDEVADAIKYAQNECTEPSADTLYDDIYADGEIIY